MLLCSPLSYAHTTGRWSLGREVAAPPAVRAAAAASAGAGSFAAADCWALGDEGGIWSGANGLGAGAGPGEGATDEAASRQLLREAFAEGDLLLLVNCPPTWVGAGDGSGAAGGRGEGRGGPEPFAAVRPGVLWPCYQVEAVTAPVVGEEGSLTGDGGAGAGGGQGTQRRVSWGVDESDLYGRSLPRQGFGDTRDRAGAFVGQDNTASLVAAVGSRLGSGSKRPGAGSRGGNRSGGQGAVGSGAHSTNGSSSGYSRSNWRSALEEEVGGQACSAVAAADEEEEEEEAQVQGTNARGSVSEGHGNGGWGAALASLPSSFVLRRGTTLGDHAACGDVEAVMARRAAVAVLPAWPYAHPFSLVDRLGAAALEEGREGLPLWLVEVG